MKEDVICLFVNRPAVQQEQNEGHLEIILAKSPLGPIVRLGRRRVESRSSSNCQ